MGPGMGELAGKVSMIMAIWMGLWLWGLALWFFIVSVGAHWSTVRHGRAKFAMTFYSYIFPNTGMSILPRSIVLVPNKYSQALTTATFALGKALSNKPINILGCVMTCLLIMGWLVVFIAMIRAVVVKDILWPQKQEDRAEGGWQVSPEEKQVCDPQCWTDSSVEGNASNYETMRTEASPQARMVGRAERVVIKEKDEETLAERDIDEITRGTAVPRRADDLV